MSGKELRRIAENYGIHLWEIAEAFGLSDSHFSRKLRHEFSPEDTERLLSIINELKKKKGIA